ncbi:DUF4360 domain-containing protein [Actinomadura sp. KC216]|uniref:DUF4360 domain-containing protein n=1 Tax=Actinomadura sp. KC216 TaxID=2530370 RepID=UPI0010473FE2|nr:DUF4360 domain-containing protein [Actinomadura sp. KC216]TDB87128.1 DUF4360 domain-containing protein [Actinomadura sp. KC216]
MHKGIARSAAVTAALALSTASVAPAAASAPAAFPPYEIEIVSQNGTGCPRGTVGAQMSGEFEAFVLYFSDYTAQAGGSSAPADARKDCRLSLKMDFRKDFSYAIGKTDYRLTSEVQSNTRATLKANHNFQGNPQNELKTYEIRGPGNGHFQFTDMPSPLVWKPCGTEPTLDITTELRVFRGPDPTKVNSLSLSSDDGSIRQVYYLQWKPCP